MSIQTYPPRCVQAYNATVIPSQLLPAPRAPGSGPDGAAVVRDDVRVATGTVHVLLDAAELVRGLLRVDLVNHEAALGVVPRTRSTENAPHFQWLRNAVRRARISME